MKSVKSKASFSNLRNVSTLLIGCGNFMLVNLERIKDMVFSNRAQHVRFRNFDTRQSPLRTFFRNGNTG